MFVQLLPQDDATLIWVDRKAMATPVSAVRRVYQSPRLSPEGRRVAVSVFDEKDNADIWIHDIDRDVPMRLTFDERIETAPVWSPDGQWIVYTSARDGGAYLARKRADGSGPEEKLTTPTNDQVAMSFSPDGKWIAFTQTLTGGTDFMMLPLEGTRAPRPFVATSYQERGGVFSPDGGVVAYVSNDSGQNQVFLRQFPDSGRKWQISNAGGTQPVWARDGKTLFYLDGSRLMSVEIARSPQVAVAPPQFLFDARFREAILGSAGRAQYDVAADGRFLFTESSDDRGVDPVIHVVVNWLDELRRRMPGGGK